MLATSFGSIKQNFDKVSGKVWKSLMKCREGELRSTERARQIKSTEHDGKTVNVSVPKYIQRD